MIALKGVSKWYTNQPRVLDQVSFDLKQGGFLYVLGGTGAGKSSLLRILATQEPPSSGTVSLFGYDLARISFSTLRTIRQALGFIPQNVALIPDLSVYDNVALSVSLAGNKGVGSPASKISELLHDLGLENRRYALARTLSGGESQRVAVARALARKPELIIADEPTGAQDRQYVWSLMDLLIKAHKAGSTVILATHDREIVRRLRKQCAVLKGGHVTIEESACFY
jgi:cell division transport system ATP-binding protein